MAISNNSTGLRTGVCTSTTRPTAPYEGQMIYETDTDMVAIWNGTAWRYIAATTPTNGTVLQVVTGSTSTEVTNNTATYADTSLTAIITPKSTTSKILVHAVHSGVYVLASNSENRVQMQLVRGASGIFNFTGGLHSYTGTAVAKIGQVTCLYIDSPSTTSATTYKTQFLNPNGTAGVLVQSGAATSIIVLTEIAG
jgi:hypothetical protein